MISALLQEKAASFVLSAESITAVFSLSDFVSSHPPLILQVDGWKQKGSKCHLIEKLLEVFGIYCLKLKVAFRCYSVFLSYVFSFLASSYKVFVILIN